MLTCQFCEEIGEKEDFEMNRFGTGFWCPCCDGFTYIEQNTTKHRFTLILEDGNAKKPLTNTAPIKLNKQLSPLRYPGGKSKVVQYIHQYLQPEKSRLLVSPFTGGGSFELAMLDANVVEEIHINDLDYGIYSLWWTILNEPSDLINRIRTIKPKHKDFFLAQELIKKDYYGADFIDAAWTTILVNRLAYSGIAKANPLGGRKGTTKALLSRWNPQSLIQRIEHIHSLADRITLTCENAVQLIEESYWSDDSTIFIDPPYIQKGKALYNRFYTMNDHFELCMLLESLHQGMPGADLIVTYDYNEWLVENYATPEIEVIGRRYSI